MIPPRKHVQEDNVDSWLMSYADMITLLLCFFIIFVSISEPKKERISQIADGMQGKFGMVDMATPFQSVQQALLAIVEKHQLYRDVAIEKSESAVEIELSSNVLFKPDSAEMIESAGPILQEMIATFKEIDYLDYRIAIEGHTSDVPVSSGLYPTNWELTSARASRMVRFFIDQGIPPQHLKAVGFADTKPKVPNLDLNNNAIVENRTRNQRMVIRVERVL